MRHLTPDYEAIQKLKNQKEVIIRHLSANHGGMGNGGSNKSGGRSKKIESVFS